MREGGNVARRMNTLLRVDLRDRLNRLSWLGASPRVNLGGVSAFVARLSARERWCVGAAGVVVGGSLVYVFLVDPVWEAHARLQTRVAAKERELREMRVLSRTYQTLHRTVERTALTTGADFSPFAFLESLASNTIGHEKVAAINPVGRDTQDRLERETIELQLQGVSLREVVDVLYKIDTASVTLRTERLSIKKRYKDPYTFDVSLTASALQAR